MNNQVSDIKLKACSIYENEADLEEALSSVLKYLHIKYREKEIHETSPILLSARLNSAIDDKKKGLIEEKDFLLAINQIKYALENYIDYSGTKSIKSRTESLNKVKVTELTNPPSSKSKLNATTLFLLLVILLQFLVILGLMK